MAISPYLFLANRPTAGQPVNPRPRWKPSGPVDVREAVFDVAMQNHWPILQMTPESASLEDVFRELTR